MLEAMQEKVPVLASNIAPHQQLLGAERGWLFESGNVESCAQFLKQAPEKHLELELMAKKAQEHIKLHYSWDKITDKNLAMYTHLAFQKVKCFYGG
jgi:glycosyltransferase involved in cell wall biosynthesis